MALQKNDNIIENLKMEKKRLEEELQKVQAEQVEYLQNVSHQLVAPLSAIKWHIENLTEGRYHNIERINKVLRSIYSQATISVHLAKNFLLMSNLMADHKLSQLSEKPQPVNICRLLVNLADDFQPLAWDKDIQIHVIDDPFDKAPEAMLIKNLISQVFSNIIENAIKYSRSGSRILIGGSYDLARKSVTVNVSNEGLPLPDGDVNQIFNRGFRSEAARNSYPAGTGFGLFIAKRIVDIHEGKISVKTLESGRVVFSVTLKLP